MRKTTLSTLIISMAVLVLAALTNIDTATSQTAPASPAEKFLGLWTGDFNQGSVRLTILPHEKENRFHYDVQYQWSGGASTNTSSKHGGGTITYEDGVLHYKGGRCMRADLEMVDDNTLKGPYENSCQNWSGNWVLKREK